MRRLVDKLYQRNPRTGRRQAEVWCAWAERGMVGVDEVRNAVMSALHGGLDAPVIVADNVAEYLYCDNDKEHWSYADDFPSMAPPFEAFWIDWRKPTRPLLTKAKDVSPEEWARIYPPEIAVYCAAQRLDDGWTLAVISFQTVHGIQWPVWDGVGWVFDLDEQGGFKQMKPKVMPGLERFAEEVGGIEGWLHMSAAALYPWALTLSFLNCKNVERERVFPPSKAKRAHRRKHGTELVDYDVLKITPFGGGGGSSSGGGGSEKRLHIVRGHFATYTEEAPLFGHFTGTVWRESHTRGHGPGHHEKRYDVQAPTKGSR